MKILKRLVAMTLATVISANTVVAQAQWVHHGTEWMYQDQAGKTLYGWQQTEPNNWYYLGSDGIMQTGFVKINNNFYYLNEKDHGVEGLMRTGWYQEPNNKNWYFFDTRPETLGAMYTGHWAWVDGYCYYFDATGKMAESTNIDGFQVDKDGRWTVDGVVQYQPGKGVPGKLVSEDDSSGSSTGGLSGSSHGSSGGSSGSSSGSHGSSSETKHTDTTVKNDDSTGDDKPEVTKPSIQDGSSKHAETDDGSDDISRYEWLMYVMDATGKVPSGNESNVNYYNDIDEDTEEGRYVLAATELGIIPNAEDMYEFDGDAPATREFAAVTTVNAMGYMVDMELTKEEKRMFTDLASLKYPVHDVISVEMEFMYSNEKDAFSPDENLIEEDAQGIIDKIEEKLYEDEHIGEDPVYEVVYKEDVLKEELEEETQYKLEQTGDNDFILTIPKNEKTKLIQKNTVFLLPDTIPGTEGITLKAKKKTESDNGNYYIIEATAPDMKEVYESLYIEERSNDIKISDIRPCEGVKITAINGVGTEIIGDSDNINKVISNTLPVDDVDLLQTNLIKKNAIATSSTLITKNNSILNYELDDKKIASVSSLQKKSKSKQSPSCKVATSSEINNKFVTYDISGNDLTNNMASMLETSHVEIKEEGNIYGRIETRDFEVKYKNYKFSGNVFFEPQTYSIVIDYNKDEGIKKLAPRLDGLMGGKITATKNGENNPIDLTAMAEELLTGSSGELIKIPLFREVYVIGETGFTANVNVNFIVDASGSLEFECAWNTTIGFVYENGRPRSTSAINPEKAMSLSLNGTLKAGFTTNGGLRFLGVKLVAGGIDLGLKFSASRTNQFSNLICTDIKLKPYIEPHFEFLIFKAYFDLIGQKTITHHHYENGVEVDKCTIRYQTCLRIPVKAYDKNVEGAEIEFKDENGNSVRKKTNQNGECIIIMPKGKYTLTVTHPDYEDTHSLNIEVDNDEKTLVLDPIYFKKPYITGKTNVGYVYYTVKTQDGTVVRRGHSDEYTGDFKIPITVGKKYEIVFEKNGYFSVSGTYTVTEPQNIDTIFMWSNKSIVTGIVTDSNTNKPLSDVICTVKYAEKIVGTYKTGPSGLYTITLDKPKYAPINKYTLIFEKEGYADSYIREIEATAERYSDKDVKMKPNGDITGTVISAATGKPLSGVKYEVKSDDKVIYSAETNNDGEYKVQRFISGKTYTLTFKYEGYMDTLEEYVINSSQHTDVKRDVKMLPVDAQPSEKYHVVLTWDNFSSWDYNTCIYPEIYTEVTTNGAPLIKSYGEEFGYSEEKNSYGNTVMNTESYIDHITTVIYGRLDEAVLRYYVYDKKDQCNMSGKSLSESNARVLIYKSSEEMEKEPPRSLDDYKNAELVAEYKVPKNKAGNTWHVFDYDSAKIKTTKADEVFYSDPHFLYTPDDDIRIVYTADEQGYHLEPMIFDEDDEILRWPSAWTGAQPDDYKNGKSVTRYLSNKYSPSVTHVNKRSGGKHRYYVQALAPENAGLSNRNILIQVYKGKKLLAEYPLNESVQGNTWHVFDWDTETQKLIFVNKIFNNEYYGNGNKPTA